MKRGSLSQDVLQNIVSEAIWPLSCHRSNRNLPQPLNKILLIFHSPLWLLTTLQSNSQRGAPFTRTLPCTKPVFMVVHVELLRLSHASTRRQYRVLEVSAPSLRRESSLLEESGLSVSFIRRTRKSYFGTWHHFHAFSPIAPASAPAIDPISSPRSKSSW